MNTPALPDNPVVFLLVDGHHYERCFATVTGLMEAVMEDADEYVRDEIEKHNEYEQLRRWAMSAEPGDLVDGWYHISWIVAVKRKPRNEHDKVHLAWTWEDYDAFIEAEGQLRPLVGLRLIQVSEGWRLEDVRQGDPWVKPEGCAWRFPVSAYEYALDLVKRLAKTRGEQWFDCTSVLTSGNLPRAIE